MELVKVKSITRKQAKSYMVLALRNIKASANNEITEQKMWDQMEVVMSLYTPKRAVENVKEKIKDTYRVKQK